jgi:hypothetical protein
MKILMAIGLALAACAAARQAAAPRAAAGPAWCFPATVRAKEGRAMVGCADTEALCRRALNNARLYGAMAGVLELGSCTRMEIR